MNVLYYNIHYLSPYPSIEQTSTSSEVNVRQMTLTNQSLRNAVAQLQFAPVGGENCESPNHSPPLLLAANKPRRVLLMNLNREII